MTTALLAIGLVLAVEGLALALAPSHLVEVMRRLAELPPERRRILGLAALALGVLLVGIAKRLAG